MMARCIELSRIAVGKGEYPFGTVIAHFFSYHLILARQNTRVTRAAGFRLTVRPTPRPRRLREAFDP